MHRNKRALRQNRPRHQGWILLLSGLCAAVFFCGEQASVWAFRPHHEAKTLETPPAATTSPTAPAVTAPAQKNAILRQKRQEGRVVERSKPPEGFTREEFPGEVLLGHPQTEQALEKAVRGFLSAHPDWLGQLPLGQLKSSHVAIVPATTDVPAIAYVQFVQQVKGLEVEGSRVNTSIKLLGDRSVLASVEVNVYPDLEPVMLHRNFMHTSAHVKEKAERVRNLVPGAQSAKRERARISYVDGKWRQVREFVFEGQPLTTAVDEETLEAWSRDDRLYDTWGTVYGAVSTGPITNGTIGKSLQSLRVTTGSGAEAFTDSVGSYYLPVPVNATVTARLQGKWATVATAVGTALSGTTSGQYGVINLPASTFTEFTIAQVNAYYYTTAIHEWVKKRLGSLTGIDLSLQVDVNEPETCNAFFDPEGPSLNFFQSGGGCINTADDTTIYHEYGHFVDDRAGGITDYGLSEGWGDVLATYATGQPLVGQGFLAGSPDSFIRTADNTYKYPSNGLDEVHELGKAWMGFAWHLRQQVGASVAEQLVLPRLAANSATIKSAVQDVVLADDNDGNLSNGTPHLAAIAAAAAQHNLPLYFYAYIDFPFVGTVFNEQTPAVIGVTGSMRASGPQSYTLSYGVGTQPTSWITISTSSVVPPVGSPLGLWDISKVPQGTYTLRLEVVALSGIKFSDYKTVAIQRAVSTVSPLPGFQCFPEIAGDYVSWAQNCYSAPATDPSLHIRQLSTGVEHEIVTFGGGYGDIPYFGMDGERVIWPLCRDGTASTICNGDMQMYQISTQAVTWLTNDAHDEYAPTLSGNYAAFTITRNGSDDIRGYDLSSRVGWNVTTNTAHDELYPKVSGTRIVYAKKNNGRWDLWLYDIPTAQHRQITSNAAGLSDSYDLPRPFRFSGDWVVWEDGRNGTADIYAYNVATNTEQPVATGPSEQYYPTISGNLVVWEDHRYYNGDIFAADLKTGVTAQLTSDRGNQIFPVVSGNRIAWEDDSSGTGSVIKMYEIPPAPVVSITIPAVGTTVSRSTPMTLTGTFTAHPKSVVTDMSIEGYDASCASGTRVFGPVPVTMVLNTSAQQRGTWTATIPGNLASGCKLQLVVHAKPGTPFTPEGGATIAIAPTGTVQGCYVLTAAFGRADHPVIQSLWQFHHQILGNQWNAPWHQAYLRWYDRVGPKIAAWISDKPWLKAMIRNIAAWGAQLTK